MSDPLICTRCGLEIVPGSMVEFVGLDPDVRIFTENDALIVHQECPNTKEGE